MLLSSGSRYSINDFALSIDELDAPIVEIEHSIDELTVLSSRTPVLSTSHFFMKRNPPTIKEVHRFSMNLFPNSLNFARKPLLNLSTLHPSAPSQRWMRLQQADVRLHYTFLQPY